MQLRTQITSHLGRRETGMLVAAMAGHRELLLFMSEERGPRLEIIAEEDFLLFVGSHLDNLLSAWLVDMPSCRHTLREGSTLLSAWDAWSRAAIWTVRKIDPVSAVFL
jgi:hypothetical protein